MPIDLVENEFIREKEFQDLINQNKSIQKTIIQLLGFENPDSYLFERESEFINGITSDFIIKDENYIKAIIECKRPDIGVTEYVRGVGQLFQYEYFMEKAILPKKHQTLEYEHDCSNNFSNVLLIPSAFIKNTKLNIGRFNYPCTSKIMEVNLLNNFVRQISPKELEILSKQEESSKITISQYYLRDNRLFEYFILLQVLAVSEIINSSILYRKEIENLLKRKINVINNGNWRNAFITLSSLGLIDNKNRLTDQAHLLQSKSYDDFTYTLYKSYVFPFVDAIMDVLKREMNSDNEVEISNSKISELLTEIYNGKEVLYLTESNNRYISSWMNIMRDDLGCISFDSRQSMRKINYFPNELNKASLKQKIRENTNAFIYLEQLKKLWR